MDQIRQCGSNKTEVDRIGLIWTEQDRMERIGTNGPNRTEVNRMDRTEPIRPKWTDWTEVDHIGPMQTE